MVMFRNVVGRLVTETGRVRRYAIKAPVTQKVSANAVSARSFSDVKDEVAQPFDVSLLEFLVCPLSKKPLR